MAGNTPFICHRRVEIDKLLEQCTPYLRKNINPLEIVRDLLDLTKFDRQQIECQTKQEGDIRGMDKLLECIARRSRECFFDFLVLLENKKYSKHSDFVIKKANLTFSPELLEARNRYKEQYGENFEGLPRQPQLGAGDLSEIIQNNTPNAKLHSVVQHYTPVFCDYPVTEYPPIQPHQQHAVHNAGRDQDIGISNNPMLQPIQNVPGGTDILRPRLPGNDDHHSNIPRQHGRYAPFSSFNLGQGGGQGGRGIPFKDMDSMKKRKDDFEIDVTPINQAGMQINPESRGFPIESIPDDLFVEQGNAALPRDVDKTSLLGSTPTNNPRHIQTYPIDGQQRVGIAGQMDPRQNILRQNLTPPIQRDQPVPFSHQQGVLRNLQDDKDIWDLPDDIFSKIAAVLSRGEGSPSWRKVGQKAGITRKEMRSIEKEEWPAESLLDMLHDNYNLTVKQLRDILRQTECYEALQILEGRGTQFQPNIDVSDDENIKVNNLSHLGGRSVRNEDKTSADFNIELSEKEGPEKVIENISAPFCREPQEHEHFKCEAYPESSSSVSESDSKSIQSNQLDSDVIQSSENQVETTIDPVEAETDQENKNAKMDAVCLSEDISANLSEGNITDTAMECVTTASVISKKIQNWNPESTEEGGEVSGIQAQGDANLLHSEKPPDQEMVRLQQEIQTQLNLSSFRDLQRSVPTELGEVSVLQAQGDANFVRSEKPPDQEMVRLQLEIQTQPNLSSFRDLQRSIPAHENDRLSTLPASEQNQNITRTNVSHYQGFEDGQKSDARNSDMSQMCIVDRKSKNEIKEDFSLVGKQVIQPNPELTPQEVSNCGSNLDACAVMAEGDQNLKQSALPPNLDHQNFKREIGTQQSTVEDCPEQSQQSNSNTGVSEAHQGEADSLRNQNSFRDIQHSVPEYRTGDLENPNSSLPRNVDSLVMDEEETFLKERHRPLLK